MTSLTHTLTSRMAVLGALAQRHGVLVWWFKALVNGFPNPIRLTELSVLATDEVRLVGQAQERRQTPEAYVSEFAIWLAEAEVCQNVRLGSSRRNAQHAQLVDFRLTCQRR